MLKLLYKISAAAILLLCFTSAVQAQTTDLKNPYSISVQALKGPSGTDVYLSFSTMDPVRYPVPELLKSLQLKMRNAAGDIVFMQNEKNIPLTGGTFTANLAGVNEHNEIEVQAKIDIPSSKKDETVKGSALCRLKPDLTVSQVFAPAEVKINEPFNVEALINEVNLETGALCDASLYIGDILFAVIPGVEVHAGGQVSVVFQGVTHSTAEIETLSVKLSNAFPGEYSTENNVSFTNVSFINPVIAQGMTYSFMYNVQKNYHYVNSYIAENGSYSNIKTQDNPHYEMFSFAGYSYPEVYPSGKILSCSIQLETENGIFRQAEIIDPAIYFEDDYYTKYDMLLPNTPMHIYVNEKSSGTPSVDFDIYQYGSNKVYIYTINGEVISKETEQCPEDYFINASERIKASILITYQNTSFYTEGILNVNPLRNSTYSFREVYFDYSIGSNIVHYIERTYQSSYSSASGLYTPGQSTKPGTERGAEISASSEKIPSRYELGQNYPNPFNPATTITFALPKLSDVTLKIYDVTGREVAILISDRLDAGYHSVTFNGGGLSSGLYLYRLQANDFVETGKMMLMK